MRDDLKLWDYAVELGYKIIFDNADILAKRVTKESIPQHSIGFEKEHVWIWQCGQSWPEVKLWWQARNVENGVLASYETRREYESLKEALDNEQTL